MKWKNENKEKRESRNICKDYIILSSICDMDTETSIYREAMSDKQVT
jgi:hypothetical protein